MEPEEGAGVSGRWMQVVRPGCCQEGRSEVRRQWSRKMTLAAGWLVSRDGGEKSLSRVSGFLNYTTTAAWHFTVISDKVWLRPLFY